MIELVFHNTCYILSTSFYISEACGNTVEIRRAVMADGSRPNNLIANLLPRTQLSISSATTPLVSNNGVNIVLADNNLNTITFNVPSVRLYVTDVSPAYNSM